MTSEIWCFVHCSSLVFDTLRFNHKHKILNKLNILNCFDKVWASDLQKMKRYREFMKKMKKSDFRNLMLCWLCIVVSDALRLIDKYLMFNKSIIMICFHKVWAWDLQKIKKYDRLMKKMKNSDFRIFNNALRVLPRGNKVDGLPRGSSLG